MRIHLFLGRIAKLYGALAVAALGVLAVLAGAIALDVWAVNRSGPVRGDGIHLRCYVLPLSGGLFAALVLWRRVVPAGHELWLAVTGQGPRPLFRRAIRVLVWLIVAATVFLLASLIQRRVFGFFLPGDAVGLEKSAQTHHPGLAPDCFAVLFAATMQSLTVTQAKPRLGHLIDQALKSKPVFIRRGNRMVQIVPAVVPEPIPSWPEGALVRSAEQIAFLQSGPDEPEPMRR